MNGMKLSEQVSDSEGVMRKATPCKQIWLALIFAKLARFGAGERI